MSDARFSTRRTTRQRVQQLADAIASVLLAAFVVGLGCAILRDWR